METGRRVFKTFFLLLINNDNVILRWPWFTFYSATPEIISEHSIWIHFWGQGLDGNTLFIGQSAVLSVLPCKEIDWKNDAITKKADNCQKFLRATMVDNCTHLTVWAVWAGIMTVPHCLKINLFINVQWVSAKGNRSKVFLFSVILIFYSKDEWGTVKILKIPRRPLATEGSIFILSIAYIRNTSLSSYAYSI